MAKRAKRKKIALFDPDEQTRKLLEELLTGMGYQVKTHQQANELSKTAQGTGKVDLLITSLSLLGDSYKQVIENLVDLEFGGADTPPAIAISSLSLSQEARSRLEQEGFRAVLSSGAPLMELIFTINRVLFPKIRELRKYARVFGGFPVQFLHQDRWREGEVYNISREGAFIQTDNLPPENTRLQVRFLLPGQDEPLQAQAFVNWVNRAQEELDRLSPQGIGVSFLTLNQEDCVSLDRFVDSRVNGEG